MNAGEIKERHKSKPDVESVFWKYFGKSNGTHCPFYGACSHRKRGHWCLDDNLRQVKHLIDLKRLRTHSYSFVQYGDCKVSRMITGLAMYYLKSSGINEPPVPTEFVRSIAKVYPIEIRSVPLNSCHGAVWYLDKECVIHINSKESLARNRYAIFHEAFHILARCHAPLRWEQTRTTAGAFKEILADAFAGAILAPDEWIKVKWADIRDPKKLAALFQVPEPVICMRLKRQGLI